MAAPRLDLVDEVRILWAARVIRAYLKRSDETRAMIGEMVDILNDEEAEKDDCFAAMVTLGEALFPESIGGST